MKPTETTTETTQPTITLDILHSKLRCAEWDKEYHMKRESEAQGRINAISSLITTLESENK